MRRSQRWPAAIDLVRHGESVGNVARDAAEAQLAPFIDIAERDMDVPLSDRGRVQARAVGDWYASQNRRPHVVLSSPYLRAAETAEIVGELVSASVTCDERLREREFGVFDRLTKIGIEHRYPEEAERRSRIGKFYYRPPSGESWCDVALRVRSALDSITREHAGKRVMVVTHEVVVYMFRYVLERLSEADVLAAARAQQLANGSITSFEFSRHDNSMVLAGFNETLPLTEASAPITAESNVPAPR